MALATEALGHDRLIGETLGHYCVHEKIGSGGMGVVYKAQDTHLNRNVALKFLPNDIKRDSHALMRFQREAEAASALKHPNIIVIYDISREAGYDFIAMEYVNGKTLGHMIPRNGISLNQLLNVAIQITDAMAAAHAAGIIHRGLKPSNIMVDEHGLVKILDFGLAKLVDRGIGEAEATATALTQTVDGAIVGTPAYFSPEQAEGKPLDARSDTFSLGVMFYEMATGCRLAAQLRYMRSKRSI